jgi:hypothetical protein
MTRRIDRRRFLAGAGACGVALSGGPDAAARILRRSLAPGPPAPRNLQQAMRGHVFHRGQPGFASAAHVNNERFDSVLADMVGRPLSTSDVRGAVRWAVYWGVPLRARSGGHSYAGYSTLKGGVVLDLRKMNSVTVNPRARTATIGAGAQLIDVYAALAQHGLTLPGGSCPSVGVAGVTLGGGMGLAGRAFGLTADNLIGAEIVTADGVVRYVDASTSPDLFWATSTRACRTGSTPTTVRTTRACWRSGSRSTPITSSTSRRRSVDSVTGRPRHRARAPASASHCTDNPPQSGAN